MMTINNYRNEFRAGEAYLKAYVLARFARLFRNNWLGIQLKRA